MYLSRFVLDPRRPDALRWLGDCHKMHQVVMGGFPHVEAPRAREQLNVLYRVELPRQGPPYVLVQSNEAPSWPAETRAFLRVEGPKDLAPLEAAIAPGRRFRFRLRANPTRRVHQRATVGADLRELDTSGSWREPADIPDHERTGVTRRSHPEDETCVGKRVAITREEERLAWLARRGHDLDGFSLVSVQVSSGTNDPPRSYFDTRADPEPPLEGRRGDAKLTFTTALFEGVLEVTDADRLRQAFRNGIGPGKAYGCGLLSLAIPK